MLAPRKTHEYLFVGYIQGTRMKGDHSPGEIAPTL